MKELTPLEVLTFFEQNLPEFISKDRKIIGLIENLRNSLQNTESSNFHANLLESGKNLLKYIIIESIQYLSNESDSPQKKSIKKITDYIDAFTSFEEMLFGLDSSYRDHTLHSLWVYLFGHHFITSIGGYKTIKIAGQINIRFPKFVLYTDPIKSNNSHIEAMWGMISILHDLGYPVEAISNRPQEVFGRILDPFAIDFISSFQIDIGSRITLLYQSVCDLLSTMYRPKQLTLEEEQKFSKKADQDSPKKMLYVKNKATITKAELIEMEFRIASVEKIHSAWSAILSFKNIAYLNESDYIGGGDRDYLKLMTKRDILYSIVHHTCEGPKDDAVNRFQFILLLMDDIEEAMRYGRGGKERGIISDYCEVKWEVGEGQTTIKLDYTKHKYKAKIKYEELENKYKAQISRKEEDYPYVIKLQFIDEDFNEELKLHFVKDDQ